MGSIGTKRAKDLELEMDNMDNVSLAVSEEYVYKSPSKMTSPEKKKFS